MPVKTLSWLDIQKFPGKTLPLCEVIVGSLPVWLLLLWNSCCLGPALCQVWHTSGVSVVLGARPCPYFAPNQGLRLGKFSSFPSPKLKSVSREQWGRWKACLNWESRDLSGSGEQESLLQSHFLWLVSPPALAMLSCPRLHHRHFRWVLGRGPEQGRKIGLYSGGSPPGVPLGTTPHAKAKWGWAIISGRWAPLFSPLWMRLQLQRAHGTAQSLCDRRTRRILINTSFGFPENPPLIKSPGLH